MSVVSVSKIKESTNNDKIPELVRIHMEAALAEAYVAGKADTYSENKYLIEKGLEAVLQDLKVIHETKEKTDYNIGDIVRIPFLNRNGMIVSMDNDGKGVLIRCLLSDSHITDWLSVDRFGEILYSDPSFKYVIEHMNDL